MDIMYLNSLEISRKHLVDRGFHFSSGLSAGEIKDLELHFGFRFPEDLKFFLQTSLPVGDGFPDWRNNDTKIGDLLRWPQDGILFDIRNRAFWWPAWGIRPQSDDFAMEIASSKLKMLPPMIPIFGHSYLPSEPLAAGNPVFSIHQADVIHRGGNLAEYLLWVKHDENDDDIEGRYPVFSDYYRHITFWSDLAKANAQA